MTFDEWYQSLDESARGLIDGHVTGLKSALEKERDGRKATAKQVTDLEAKLAELDTLKGELDNRQKGYSDLEAKLSEAQKETQRLQRVQMLRDVAETEKVKPSVLAMLDGQGAYTYELRDVTEGEATVKRAFIKAGEGEAVAFSQFVDTNWGELKPALYAATTTPQPTTKPHLAQGSGAPAKPVTTATVAAAEIEKLYGKKDKS